MKNHTILNIVLIIIFNSIGFRFNIYALSPYSIPTVNDQIFADLQEPIFDQNIFSNSTHSPEFQSQPIKDFLQRNQFLKETNDFENNQLTTIFTGGTLNMCLQSDFCDLCEKMKPLDSLKIIFPLENLIWAGRAQWQSGDLMADPIEIFFTEHHNSANSGFILELYRKELNFRIYYPCGRFIQKSFSNNKNIRVVFHILNSQEDLFDHIRIQMQLNNLTNQSS